MVIIHSKLSNFVITITYTHMCRKLTNWGHLMVHNNNQEAREMWLPLRDIQEIHKTHDKIIGTRYGNLPEHVTIQKWYIKQPHPSVNNIGVSKYRLQQANNPVWSLCTSILSHLRHHEAENSGRNFNTLRKRTGWILFHVNRY